MSVVQTAAWRLESEIAHCSPLKPGPCARGAAQNTRLFPTMSEVRDDDPSHLQGLTLSQVPPLRAASPNGSPAGSSFALRRMLNSLILVDPYCVICS